MEHVLPSLIRRQWKASVVQRDPSGNLFPRVPESPTQKEVWNLSSCPQPASYRTPAPALGHNLQSATVSLQGPSPHHTHPCPGSLPETRGAVLQGRGRVWPVHAGSGFSLWAAAPLRALGRPTLAGRLCGLLERMSAASLQRVERFRMAAAAATWVSSPRWPWLWELARPGLGVWAPALSSRLGNFPGLEKCFAVEERFD